MRKAWDSTAQRCKPPFWLFRIQPRHMQDNTSFHRIFGYLGGDIDEQTFLWRGMIMRVRRIGKDDMQERRVVRFGGCETGEVVLAVLSEEGNRCGGACVAVQCSDKRTPNDWRQDLTKAHHTSMLHRTLASQHLSASLSLSSTPLSTQKCPASATSILENCDPGMAFNCLLQSRVRLADVKTSWSPYMASVVCIPMTSS
jgi:hypothetical protein